MIIFAWIIAVLLIAFVMYVWVIPFIQMKIGLYKLARILKKMSKKYPEMEDIASLAKKVAKDCKIDDI